MVAVHGSLTHSAALCYHLLFVLQIPSSYYHICSHLNSKVIKRFDGSTEGVAVEDPVSLTRVCFSHLECVLVGVSSTDTVWCDMRLFLAVRHRRLLVPPIRVSGNHDPAPVQPHRQGAARGVAPRARAGDETAVQDGDVCDVRRERTAVQVRAERLTTLLIPLARSVDADRCSFARILNPFIEQNSPLIQQLFIDLSQPPKKDIDECFASDSRNIFSEVDSGQLESDMTLVRPP